MGFWKDEWFNETQLLNTVQFRSRFKTQYFRKRVIKWELRQLGGRCHLSQILLWKVRATVVVNQHLGWCCWIILKNMMSFKLDSRLKGSLTQILIVRCQESTLEPSKKRCPRFVRDRLWKFGSQLRHNWQCKNFSNIYASNMDPIHLACKCCLPHSWSRSWCEHRVYAKSPTKSKVYEKS